MNTLKFTIKHFHELHQGGNWPGTNMKEILSNINWKDATNETNGLNSIAKLVYHINYYISIMNEVLQGKPLQGHDNLSFNVPEISNEEQWNDLLAKFWKQSDDTVQLLKQLSEEQLWLDFDEPKYGNYYRNIQGLIQHTYYHLGQIAIIKKIVQANS